HVGGVTEPLTCNTGTPENRRLAHAALALASLRPPYWRTL
ncbi:MAG: hypothetical protein QOD41_3466, partial [Cryptosporangiaceae bacterium]|nr:hypothetical protein [Cryptosporangiaceae bacterium]